MKNRDYAGLVVIDYTRIDWMLCNEVDISSETILMRDFALSINVEA